MFLIPLIMMAASAAMQASAASKQATTAAQIGDYNAKVDIANAEQLAKNANVNIQKQRTENQSYLSSQRAAYAASGILSGTGSPMTVQATTAGRMEEDVQQYWYSVQQKESTLYAAAQLGVYEGHEQASAYHLQGAAAIFKGIGSVAGMMGSGAGAGIGGGGGYDPSMQTIMETNP